MPGTRFGVVASDLLFCFFLLGHGTQRITGGFIVSLVCLPSWGFWLRTQLLVLAHPAIVLLLHVLRSI